MNSGPVQTLRVAELAGKQVDGPGLERAVVELRDEFEDLTQEQVLAALLHENVDAADPALLVELAESVRRYRRELGRV